MSGRARAAVAASSRTFQAVRSAFPVIPGSDVARPDGDGLTPADGAGVAPVCAAMIRPATSPAAAAPATTGRTRRRPGLVSRRPERARWPPVSGALVILWYR